MDREGNTLLAVSLAAATLLLGCVARDVDGQDSTETSDPASEDTRDSTDLSPADSAHDSPIDDPGTDPADEDTRPPLGLCGGYCMGEFRTCPGGAICEYGALDILDSCTEDGCGFCAWIPEECPPEDEPVCGCDGVVYPNACERRLAQVLPDFTWASCTVPETDV